MDDVKPSSKAKGNDKQCCAPLCNRNGRRHTDLSFHRFPQTDHRRNMWINAIRRDPGPMFNVIFLPFLLRLTLHVVDVKVNPKSRCSLMIPIVSTAFTTEAISDQTVVCSRHFKSTDFKWTPVRKTLKPDSVPSIFDWSNLITPRRELFKHPVSQKRPRPESDIEIEAEDDITDLGCEPYPEFQDADLTLCLYTGCILDVEITQLFGLVDLLEMGDSIMADKGFVCNKVLEGTGITVNTPPFIMSHGQFTKQEDEETQTIAKLRIHIRRVKEYHLFDKIIPLSMVGTINQLWTVANMLTLFRGPLVKEWH
ncbi:unnamed protein product [Mytilus coruscus]|uniref:THAP-type domain-containing protein n=1 Tax=Mytilus coruscus TaxID=42192 RepID=A0A6J8ES04_MYTCO|nr:unnamed protein product [Mytilus coruscus]